MVSGRTPRAQENHPAEQDAEAKYYPRRLFSLTPDRRLPPFSQHFNAVDSALDACR